MCSLSDIVQFHHNPHYPSRLIHCPDQRMHCHGRVQLKGRLIICLQCTVNQTHLFPGPAADRLLQHQCYPRGHHRQYPTFHSDTVPLVPHSSLTHQQAEGNQQCKLHEVVRVKVMSRVYITHHHRSLLHPRNVHNCGWTSVCSWSEIVQFPHIEHYQGGYSQYLDQSRHWFEQFHLSGHNHTKR